jgi:NMD protein affecting ribosome stability and mRNA decay
MRAAKNYNTQYKKKVDVERDTYLPRLSPKEMMQCAGCGAFYHRRHWMLATPAGFKLPVHVHPIYCPACRKIKQWYPSGELSLRGVETAERQEILRILCNEEEQARTKNPLEMIMGLQETDGHWKVETTTEKLAQRLGRSIKKARGGKLVYKWGHNNKFVRLVWE